LKVKKAAKRLSRAEALLSSVLDGYAADTAELREPLQAAVAAVKRALSAIDSNQSSGNRQTAAKSARTARTPDPGNAETAEKASLAGNKRSTHASQKGVRTLAAASHGKFSEPRKRVSSKGINRIAERNKRRQGNQRATRNSQTPITQKAERIKKQASPAGGRAAKQIPASEATTQAAASG
jgi:hypothetical protein